MNLFINNPRGEGRELHLLRNREENYFPPLEDNPYIRAGACHRHPYKTEFPLQNRL